MPVEPRLKLVVVGDGACGKTSLLISFVQGCFSQVYKPTVFENHVGQCEVDGKTVHLALWDTAGQEDYDRLRPLSYPDADIILICISVDSPDSLANAKEKWYSEVRHFCPGKPYLLVCCKSDLRDDKEYEEKNPEQFVSFEDVQRASQVIRAQKCIECSAKTGKNIDMVFKVAAQVALGSKKSKQKSCFIL